MQYYLRISNYQILGFDSHEVAKFILRAVKEARLFNAYKKWFAPFQDEPALIRCAYDYDRIVYGVANRSNPTNFNALRCLAWQMLGYCGKTKVNTHHAMEIIQAAVDKAILDANYGKPHMTEVKFAFIFALLTTICVILICLLIFFGL